METFHVCNVTAETNEAMRSSLLLLLIFGFASLDRFRFSTQVLFSRSLKRCLPDAVWSLFYVFYSITKHAVSWSY